MEENLFNALTAATISSDSYIASDGYTVYVILSGVVSLPLLPATGINGFYLYLNGARITTKPGYIQNSSG